MLQFTLSAARSDCWPVTTHIGLLARNNSHRSDCWPVTTPTIYPARHAPVRRRCLASRASVLLSALRAPPLPPLYPLLLLLLSPPLTSVTPRPPGLATPAPPATALRSLLLPHHPPSPHYNCIDDFPLFADRPPVSCFHCSRSRLVRRRPALASTQSSLSPVPVSSPPVPPSRPVGARPTLYLFVSLAVAG